MKDFDWKDLMAGITHAHCEAQGIEVTRSSSGNGGSRTKDALEVVHIPINASNSVAAESLPENPQSPDTPATGAVAQAAPEISCGGVEGHATAIEGANYAETQTLKYPWQRVLPHGPASVTCGVESRVGDVGSEYQASPAGTILTAHCHRVSGLTLVERIEATLTPLQVAILDAEMRLQPKNDDLGGYHDPAEGKEYA